MSHDPAADTAAISDLRAQVAGFDLTDLERETVGWLTAQHRGCIRNVASIIAKARASGPVQNDGREPGDDRLYSTVDQIPPR